MEKYYVSNIRVGHATNSSSSHSIVFNNTGFEETYSEEVNHLNNVYDEAFYFENVEAISTFKIDKLYYLIEAVIVKLKQTQISNDKCLSIINDLIDMNKIKDTFDLNENLFLNILSEIDSDSWRGDYNEFKQYLTNDKFIKDNFEQMIIDNFKIIYEHLVLNDYVGIKSDLEYGDSEIADSFINQHLSLKSYNDRYYLYNNSTGLKISIERVNSKDIINVPELVDMKITDRCSYNCDFCYQGSTINGCESDLSKIEKTIEYLDNLNCFEIAVAGGDPTKMFEQIFDSIDLTHREIVLNTTTKNYKEGFRIVNKLKTNKNFGAIGFSITNMKEFEDLKFIYKTKTNELSNEKFAFQYCPAFFNKKEIEEIIKYCLSKQIRLVHLGFKEIGRGKNYKIKNPDYLEDLEQILKNKDWGLLIDFDQVIIDTINDNFKRSINRISYSNKEGLTSMYIDLVNNKIGLSSYDGLLLPLEDSDYETFKKNIQRRYELLSDHKTLS